MNTYGVNPCDRCRCPDVCLGRFGWPGYAVFCSWAAEDPQDPVKMTAACEKSRRAAQQHGSNGVADPRAADIDRELVVARFKEPLAWLDDVPPDIAVSVYDKSGVPYEVRRPVRREPTINAGREAFTMLYHITKYYDSLAEWTYFVHGDAPRHAPDIISRLAVAYDRPTSMTATYTDIHPSAEVHAADRVERIGGFEVRYGRCDIDAAAWDAIFACPRPDPGYFGYAAHWAVPRRSILARPRTFWSNLMDLSMRLSQPIAGRMAGPVLNPWNLENLWMYIFGDPAEYPHRLPDRPGRPPIPGVVVGEGGALHVPDAGVAAAVTAAPAPVAPAYPPLGQQARNFAGAMGRVASAAIHGQPVFAPADVVESRKQICIPCDFNGLKNTGMIRCTKCGCGGAKLTLATEQCPAGKWGVWRPGDLPSDPPGA